MTDLLIAMRFMALQIVRLHTISLSLQQQNNFNHVRTVFRNENQNLVTMMFISQHPNYFVILLFFPRRIAVRDRWLKLQKTEELIQQIYRQPPSSHRGRYLCFHERTVYPADHTLETFPWRTLVSGKSLEIVSLYCFYHQLTLRPFFLTWQTRAQISLSLSSFPEQIVSEVCPSWT